MKKITIKIKRTDLKKERNISLNRPKVQTNKKVYKRGENSAENIDNYFFDTNLYN